MSGDFPKEPEVVEGRKVMFSSGGRLLRRTSGRIISAVFMGKEERSSSAIFMAAEKELEFPPRTEI